MSENKATPLQKAWAAGVLEARGVYPPAGYYARMETTDRAMLIRFMKIVGVGSIKTSEKPKQIHVSYIWCSQKADDTRELFLMLSPFLSAKTLAIGAKLIAKIERSPYWQKNYPEKAATAVAIDPDTIPEYQDVKSDQKSDHNIKLEFPVIKPVSEYGFKGHPRHRDIHDRLARRWIETGWGPVKLHREFPELPYATVASWILKLQKKAASLGTALAASAEAQTQQPSTQVDGLNVSPVAKTTRTVMRTEKITLD